MSAGCSIEAVACEVARELVARLGAKRHFTWGVPGAIKEARGCAGTLVALLWLVSTGCSSGADRTMLGAEATADGALRSTTTPGDMAAPEDRVERGDTAGSVVGDEMRPEGDGVESAEGDRSGSNDDAMGEETPASDDTEEDDTGNRASEGHDVDDMPPEEPPSMEGEPSDPSAGEPPPRSPEPPPLCRIGVTEAGRYAAVEEGGILPLIGGVQANLILMLGIEVRQALELSTVRIEMWIESDHGAEREYYTLGGPSPSCAAIDGETRCQLASLAIATSPLAEDPFDLELLPVEVRASLMHRGQLLCEPTLRGRLQRAR